MTKELMERLGRTGHPFMVQPIMDDYVELVIWFNDGWQLVAASIGDKVLIKNDAFLFANAYCREAMKEAMGWSGDEAKAVPKNTGETRYLWRAIDGWYYEEESFEPFCGWKEGKWKQS